MGHGPDKPYNLRKDKLQDVVESLLASPNLERLALQQDGMLPNHPKLCLKLTGFHSHVEFLFQGFIPILLRAYHTHTEPRPDAEAKLDKIHFLYSCVQFWPSGCDILTSQRTEPCVWAMRNPWELWPTVEEILNQGRTETISVTKYSSQSSSLFTEPLLTTYISLNSKPSHSCCMSSRVLHPTYYILLHLPLVPKPPGIVYQ